MIKADQSDLNAANKKRLVASIDKLRATEEDKLKRANRRDYIAYGAMIALYAGLAVLLAISKNSDALYMLGYIVWVVLICFLQIQINQQRFIIEMQFGLKEIEHDELKRQLSDDETPLVKAVKKAAAK